MNRYVITRLLSESFAQNCFALARVAPSMLNNLDASTGELDDATHVEVEAPQVMPRFGWYGVHPGSHPAACGLVVLLSSLVSNR